MKTHNTTLFMNSALLVTLCGLSAYVALNGRTNNTQDPGLARSFGLQKSENVQVIEKIVSSSQVWRPVQERVRDSVIQVFAQVVEVDLLQPYKTPMQGSSCGTGFFINGDGYIITNWHVIDQAKAVWVQIPSLGKRIIDVELVGLSPDRDIALLRVIPEDLEVIRQELGKVSFLPFGDSDDVFRSDEVMAIGFPLGQQSLKSTSGIISGREHHLIQTSAPINPGNSGGPLINIRGEVIGINEANVPSAQNVGYAIPINDVKIVLPDLHKIKLLRKPFLGVLFNNGSPALTEYLGNPEPGGCYVVEVVEGSTLARAGVESGDMIYELNGHVVDMFGEMTVPWGEDKLSIVDYVSRLAVGETISLTFYRKGERKEIAVSFAHAELPAIHKVYPGYEEIDYEVVPGGMVVTELTLNHVQLLGNQAPGLMRYTELKNQKDSVLLVTHIFPNSQLYRARTLAVGSTLNEVNGEEVHTLEDLRKALKKGIVGKFLTVRASDNVSRASDNIRVVLPWSKILDDEMRLSRDYHYPLSDTVNELIAFAESKKAINTPTALFGPTVQA